MGKPKRAGGGFRKVCSVKQSPREQSRLTSGRRGKRTRGKKIAAYHTKILPCSELHPRKKVERGKMHWPGGSYLNLVATKDINDELEGNKEEEKEETRKDSSEPMRLT